MERSEGPVRVMGALDRAAALLGLASAAAEPALTAQPAEPAPTAEAVGASAAVAYRWPDGVVATVYEFESNDAAVRYGAGREADDPSVSTTTNGGLLLVASGEAEHVRALGSDFAGRE